MSNFFEESIAELTKLYSNQDSRTAHTRSARARKILLMLEGYFKHREATFDELLQILKAGYSGQCSPQIFDDFVKKILTLDVETEQTMQVLDILPKLTRFQNLRKEIIKKLAKDGVDAETCINLLSN